MKYKRYKERMIKEGMREGYTGGQNTVYISQEE